MSGYYGDRFSAAREMVEGGPIDFLTGDYLAELTMAILYKSKLKRPEAGYAITFLKQMEGIMGTCLDRNIKVVVNAGGLNPSGLAAALEEVASRLGLNPKIAYIDGDDLIGRLAELQKQGQPFRHLDKGINLSESSWQPVTANAYLGCWGVVEALNQGANIVVTGRIADTSLVMGPAAYHFGWEQHKWDELAGAAVAGHVIECSGQATGGNYSFFQEVPTFRNLGFPIAEIFKDGSSVITKHPGTGGLVSVGTVTAQLFYEINAPAYITPDVVAHFDTIQLVEEGQDRVRISQTKGSPATDTAKVCINCMSGFKNTLTFVLTGMDIEQKARLIEKELFDSLGGKEAFEEVDVQLVRSDHVNPTTNEEAYAQLRVSVMDPDPRKVGKKFSSKVIELALSSIPGFTLTTPPTDSKPVITHWPALVDKKFLEQNVVVAGVPNLVNEVATNEKLHANDLVDTKLPEMPEGEMIKIQLGKLFATRSGDKGGNANLGIWSKTPQGYAFLVNFLTIEKLRELLPDTAKFAIDRHELPNLLGLNFYLRGYLGEGVAASTKMDPQAKTLGEYLRAKVIEAPTSLSE